MSPMKFLILRYLQTYGYNCVTLGDQIKFNAN